MQVSLFEYSLCLTIIVSLPFFLFLKIIDITNATFIIIFHYYTLIYWISSNLTTSLTTINKSVLVNDTNFTIKINTINHFVNNRA